MHFVSAPVSFIPIETIQWPGNALIKRNETRKHFIGIGARNVCSELIPIHGDKSVKNLVGNTHTRYIAEDIVVALEGMLSLLATLLAR
jgi:hypothetical protein